MSSGSDIFPFEASYLGNIRMIEFYHSDRKFFHEEEPKRSFAQKSPDPKKSAIFFGNLFLSTLSNG
ncbi:hypothetical protein NXC24_PC00758 (plasmid) [Rhizobium sp. NXC24]|nr:hypothetical protein NXC24_PC00758 [Rhizobium sp. NXC24]